MTSQPTPPTGRSDRPGRTRRESPVLDPARVGDAERAVDEDEPIGVQVPLEAPLEVPLEDLLDQRRVESVPDERRR